MRRHGQRARQSLRYVGNVGGLSRRGGIIGRLVALLLVAAFVLGARTHVSAQDRLPTGDELWDRARAVAIADSANLPPYAAYIADLSFTMKGKPRLYHYRYVFRTRDNHAYREQLPDSPSDRLKDTAPDVDVRAFSPFSLFDLGPRTTGALFPGVGSGPTPDPAETPAPPVIGSTRVISRLYDVKLAGRETVDGQDVWHLLTTPRADPKHHQLREVYTRVSDDRPVRMKLEAHAVAGPIHSSPSFIFNYREINGRAMVDSGSTDIAVQMMFVRAGGALAIHLHDVTFPVEEPDWMFDGKLLAEHQAAK